MQVCIAGHVINDTVTKYPEYNKEFCDQCWKKTITKCAKCDADIPGKMQGTSVAVIAVPVAPDFCQKCGEPYPWKKGKADAIPIVTSVAVIIVSNSLQ
jgi:hypothetical protein